MLGRCFCLLILSGTVALAVPKGSAKRELQQLVRTPRVEFPVPLEFHRRFGFVAFGDETMAGDDAAEILKEAKGSPDDAALHLRAAYEYDAQGNMGGALRQYSKATELYRKRLEVSPDELRTIVGLGEALTALGRFGEAESVLERGGGAKDAELWLARAKLNREKAWFAAVGEGQRYAASTFMDQLVSMVAFSLDPARVEEAKRLLRRADEAMKEAFECETTTRAMEVSRLLERAAFRSFQSAMELAFSQIQGVELKSRLLKGGIFSEQAMHDLVAAAEASDDPSVLAAAVLAGAAASDVLANWAPKGEEGGGAEFFARQVASRLQRMAEVGGQNGAAAAEYLGCLQVHVLRDPRGAERSFRQALALNKGRHRSWEMLTYAAVQQGTEEFLEVAEERATALPSPRSIVLQVKSFERSGDSLRGAWVALNGAGTYPNDWLVNLTLAAMLLKDESTEVFLWRVDEALKKAEKGMGANAKRQARLDFVLVKSVFLGMSDKADEAKELVESAKPLTPELQEVLRALE